MPASLNLLEKQVVELDQLADAMGQRLSQAGVLIMASVAPGTGVLSASTPAPCEMAQRITGLTRRLNDVSMRLQAIMASLEL